MSRKKSTVIGLDGIRIVINLKTPFSEQMIDKYGMEVEDIDDFLDAFVSTEIHGLALVSQRLPGNKSFFSESIFINGTYRYVRSYKL